MKDVYTILNETVEKIDHIIALGRAPAVIRMNKTTQDKLGEYMVGRRLFDLPVMLAGEIADDCATVYMEWA